jgi:hypothetical protein
MVDKHFICPLKLEIIKKGKDNLDINIIIQNPEEFSKYLQQVVLQKGKKEFRYFEINNYQIELTLKALEEYSKELNKVTEPTKTDIEMESI